MKFILFMIAQIAIVIFNGIVHRHNQSSTEVFMLSTIIGLLVLYAGLGFTCLLKLGLFA